MCSVILGGGQNASAKAVWQTGRFAPSLPSSQVLLIIDFEFSTLPKLTDPKHQVCSALLPWGQYFSQCTDNPL